MNSHSAKKHFELKNKLMEYVILEKIAKKKKQNKFTDNMRTAF
jgi:hypothetical protein